MSIPKLSWPIVDKNGVINTEWAYFFQNLESLVNHAISETTPPPGMDAINDQVLSSIYALPNPEPSVRNLIDRIESLEMMVHGAASASSFRATFEIPVGMIVITRTNVAPFSYGTWTLVLQGKFPVGYKSGDADFGTGAATGGVKTHKHTVDPPNTTSGVPSSTTDATLTGSAVASSTHTHAVDIAVFDSETVSNLPPFEVVFFWERTS